MILDIAKVLEMIIFPSTVKFRILHNFSTFSIFQTCLIKFSSLSSFYYKKNIFLKFLLFFGLSQYNQYHRVSVIPISGYPFHLNLNLIGYQSSAKGRGFVNVIIQHSLVLFFFNISHFPPFLWNRLNSSDKKVTIRKRVIKADLIQEFRDISSVVDWGNSIWNLTPTMPINISWKFLVKISVKRRTLKKPWMTKGLLKLSKRKQKNFLKNVHEMKALTKYINLSLKF